MAVTLCAAESTGWARQIAGARAKYRDCINTVFTVVLRAAVGFRQNAQINGRID
jgi:hypothetical protein